MKKWTILLTVLICLFALSACTISITDETSSNGATQQPAGASTTARAAETGDGQPTSSETTASAAETGAAQPTGSATTASVAETGATQSANDDGCRVSEEEWDQLFSVENITFRSNYKMTVSIPENEWGSTMSFDSGKIYLTGLGLRTQRDGEEPVEQRTDGYLHMKSVSDGIATFDEYVYWGKWTVEEKTENLTDFFFDYLLVEHRYQDFAFDEETQEYKKPATVSDDPENAGGLFNGEWTVKIRDKKIVEQKVVNNGMQVIITCSDYGEIHVTFPEVEE